MKHFKILSLAVFCILLGSCDNAYHIDGTYVENVSDEALSLIRILNSSYTGLTVTISGKTLTISGPSTGYGEILSKEKNGTTVHIKAKVRLTDNIYSQETIEDIYIYDKTVMEFDNTTFNKQ